VGAEAPYPDESACWTGYWNYSAPTGAQGMSFHFSLFAAAFLLAPQPSAAQQIEEVRGNAETRGLPRLGR
jgi:hypothetical protein